RAQRLLAERGELRRQRLCPRERLGRALQHSPRGQLLLLALLAEHVVAHFAAAVGAQPARLARREQSGRGVCAILHRAFRDVQQRRQFGVALAAPEQQRQRRLLVGWELIQSAHQVGRGARARAPRAAAAVDLGYRGAAMAEPTVSELNHAVQGFDRLYGLELLGYDEQEVRARVAVRDELKQPAGLLHGGVYASIAES